MIIQLAFCNAFKYLSKDWSVNGDIKTNQLCPPCGRGWIHRSYTQGRPGNTRDYNREASARLQK